MKGAGQEKDWLKDKRRKEGREDGWMMKEGREEEENLGKEKMLEG